MQSGSTGPSSHTSAPPSGVSRQPMVAATPTEVTAPSSPAASSPAASSPVNSPKVTNSSVNSCSVSSLPNIRYPLGSTPLAAINSLATSSTATSSLKPSTSPKPTVPQLATKSVYRAWLREAGSLLGSFCCLFGTFYHHIRKYISTRAAQVPADWLTLSLLQ